MFLFISPGHRVSEGEQASADSALPPADLQAAGGGDGWSRTGLPADESLQAHDQGRPEPTNYWVASTSQLFNKWDLHVQNLLELSQHW